MITQQQAMKAIERAQAREMRAMLKQASAASERAESLEQLATAYTAATPLSSLSGPGRFTERARLARREAAIARSQSRVHVREAARAEAEIEAIRSKVPVGMPALARNRRAPNKR